MHLYSMYTLRRFCDITGQHFSDYLLSPSPTFPQALSLSFALLLPLGQMTQIWVQSPVQVYSPHLNLHSNSHVFCVHSAELNVKVAFREKRGNESPWGNTGHHCWRVKGECRIPTENSLPFTFSVCESPCARQLPPRLWLETITS